jgi:hypothetical protein
MKFGCLPLPEGEGGVRVHSLAANINVPCFREPQPHENYFC